MMSGAMTTFMQTSAIPPTSSAAVVPPLKIIIPANASKTSPVSGAKSRVKTTPRRGKVQGANANSTAVHEQSLYPQAVSTVSDVASPLPTPNVPVVLNSQPCSVLLVSDSPHHPSATVPSILVSGPTSQPQNSNPVTVQTTFLPNHADASNPMSLSAVLAKSSRPAKIVYTDSTVIYTMANSSHLAALPSSATLPKPGGLDVKPDALPTPNSAPAPTFQVTKPKGPLQRQSKPKVSDPPRTKPVRPKASAESVVIDLCDTPPATSDTRSFVIQADQAFTFHGENSVVSDSPSTNVGYAINIADILPPKPNQLCNKASAPAPPNLKPAQRVNVSTRHSQALPPMSTLTQGAQLNPSPQKDGISVKSQSKMMAAPQLVNHTRVSAPVTSSFIQLQSGGTSNVDSVIPIAILSGHGQPSMTYDAQEIHTSQFLSHGLPHLVPFHSLPPTSTGLVNSSPKPSKVCNVVTAPMEAIDVVEVISVNPDDPHLRVSGNGIVELHPGLNRNVPEPYATDLLSQLAEDGALPAMSSSQVSSLLSALDSQQPDSQQHLFQQELVHSQDQLQESSAKPEVSVPSQSQLPEKMSPPKPVKKAATQPKPKSKKKQTDDNNDGKGAATPKEKEKSPAKRKRKAKPPNSKTEEESKLVERVQCFKCRFCLYLTLDKDAVTKHIEEQHSSYTSNANHNEAGLPCPGCSNVFLSKRSLSVHLTEDHKVAVRELNDIVSALADLSGEKKAVETGPQQAAKKSKPVKERGKRTQKNSAKIRVRNLLTTTPTEEAELSGSEPVEVAESSPSRRNSASRTRRLVGGKANRRSVGKAAQVPIKDAMPSSELGIHDKLSEIVQVQIEVDHGSGHNYNFDDHDYSNLHGSLSDSSLEGEPRKKKRRGPRKKRLDSEKKTRKRAQKHHQSDCETTGCGNQLMQTSYKCNVPFCAIRMRSHDKLVYHQRCHKERAEAKSAPQDVKIHSSDSATGKVEEESLEDAPNSEAAGDVPETAPVTRKTEYCCPECGLILRNWVQMSGHLWRSHSIDMELHSCDQSDYKTTSMSNLVNLHQRTHSAERPFSCDSCDKSFKTTKQLRNHKIIHANKIKAAAGEASACNICGRSFADARLLRSHISAVHIKLRPYRCSTCGYAASSNSTLKMHMRQHTGEKPFHCDECSYMTADHNSLRRHKKRHSGDKPYKCPHCFYACIQSSTYKVHLRTKHPGQGEGLMFSCQNCPFHTISHDIYRAHLAQHKTQPSSAGKPASNGVNIVQKPPVKSRFHVPANGSSDHPVATAAVSEHIPIILSFSTEDAHASEAPSMHAVVDEVSEAIIPGSDLHLLYSNFTVGSFSQQQTSEANNTVVYGSQQTQDFVMSMLSDSVIQVVDERDNDTQLVTLAEERITGDLGELQDNGEDLKFKLCEEVVRS